MKLANIAVLSRQELLIQRMYALSILHTALRIVNLNLCKKKQVHNS
jgi:hypothetical protein